MNNKKNVLAISGSTRSASTNLNLINAIKNLYTDVLNLHLYTGLTELPYFNPDIDNDNPPDAVINFREQIKAADGVLICTPEYAMGVPGTLKNALDWTVSSCEFSHKPVALITASTSGQKAHVALLATLEVIEAKMNVDTALIVQFAKTKVNDKSEITDQKTLEQVQSLVNSFIKIIDTPTS